MIGDHTGTEGRSLVIAIGNRFRSDDGAAGSVLDLLASDPSIAASTDLLELDGEPSRIVDAWSGRRLVVLVDALLAGDTPPGTVIELADVDALDTTTVARWSAGVSGHSAGPAEALRLGLVLERMPEHIVVVGIVANSMAEGPGLSPVVAEAVPAAAATVRGLLEPASLEKWGVADVPR